MAIRSPDGAKNSIKSHILLLSKAFLNSYLSKVERSPVVVETIVIHKLFSHSHLIFACFVGAGIECHCFVAPALNLTVSTTPKLEF